MSGGPKRKLLDTEPLGLSKKIRQNPSVKDFGRNGFGSGLSRSYFQDERVELLKISHNSRHR